MADDIFGIKPSSRTIVPSGIRRTGFEASTDGKAGVFDKYLNQIIFEAKANQVWGTEAQTKSDPPESTFYTNGSGAALDSSNAPVAFVDGDKVLMVYDSTLTANLVLDAGSKRLDIFQGRGVTINLGADAGNSNVPFKIQLLNADKSEAKFFTDKDFEDVVTAKPAATRLEKSVISNQTKNSNIWLNGRQIFGRRRTEGLLSKTLDPYSIFLDGTNNLLQDEHKDLFGLIGFSSTAGIDSAITNGFFSVPNYLGRVSRAGNGSSSIAPDSHTRTGTSSFTQWPNTTTNISASLTTGSNTVTVDATADGTEADNILFLQNCIGMRCKSASAGIPDETASPDPVTSIIQSVDISTPSSVILTLIDSITGADADATATASEDLTISNSGDCLGSTELDQSQAWQLGSEKDDSGVRDTWGRSRTRSISVSGTSNTSSFSVIQFNTSAQGDDNKLTAMNDGSNSDIRKGKQNKMINIEDFKYFLL